VEAEVREQLAPLLKLLAGAGVETNEPTLGGCITAIRTAYHANRRREVTLANDVGEAVKQLHGFFSQNGYIEGVRNRASHANRDELISIGELVQWKTAILYGGLFSVLRQATCRI
jgi:hypothetical protein